jgi:hypothetical protein
MNTPLFDLLFTTSILLDMVSTGILQLQFTLYIFARIYAFAVEQYRLNTTLPIWQSIKPSEQAPYRLLLLYSHES